MKKIISLTLALSTLISAGTFTAFAEDKAVPVDVDEAVYAQLMENEWICDKNDDGIITDEELKQVTQLDIDLDGIKDLSWVSKLEKCHYITFENGDTYRYEDHGDAWTTTVTITLNGEMQNTTKYKYHNFGWKAVETV